MFRQGLVGMLAGPGKLGAQLRLRGACQAAVHTESRH
jgi:hypothetical protein